MCLNILIVEDNFDDMENCANLIKEVSSNAKLYKVGTGKAALQVLSKIKIDVFFVDVLLPDIGGFKLVSKIRKINQYQFTDVIFVTGENVDQLKVFKKYHCYEYISKPFSKESFKTTIEPLLIGLHQKNSEEQVIKDPIQMVYVESEGVSYLVKYDEILYVETLRRKLNLYTRKKNYYNIPMKLVEFIGYINNDSFKRCHKSFAVNVKQISHIQTKARRLWDIYFDDEDLISCPLSDTYYSDILELFKQRTKKG